MSESALVTLFLLSLLSGVLPIAIVIVVNALVQAVKKLKLKTPAVGQDVYMFGLGGHSIAKGKVVKVAPEGVDVRTVRGELLLFDTDGEAYGGLFGGTWKLDTMPFAERTALLAPAALAVLEQAASDYQRWAQKNEKA
jgi:hypothetical protein